MRRRFNITGSCSPQRHYMVQLDNRLEKIKEDFVDYGSYFVINRGRQYGKTTTLRALKQYLKGEYIVVSLDFQELGTEEFADTVTFTRAFADVFARAFKMTEISGMRELLEPLNEIRERHDIGLKDLFVRLSGMCEKSPSSDCVDD